MANHAFPTFYFNESNVGPRPVRTASVDRIGMVGQFARGPLTPQIVGAEDAHNLFGFTSDVGSVHLQAMCDQGADSFVIQRVLGAATFGALSVTTSGTASGAGSLAVDIKLGSTTVTATATIANSDTAAVVAGKVITAVNTLVGNTYVTATAGTTGQVIFTAKTAGAAGNSIQIKFTLNTTTGLTFNPSGITTFTNLAGGADGPLPGTLAVLDGSSGTSFTLNAAWPGATGNNITATITAGSDTGKFTLTVKYPAENVTEVYPDFDLTDIYQETQLSFLKNSLLVRGTIGTGTDPVLLATTSLSGGGDGPAVQTSDFTAAIDLLKDQQCTVLVCPGIKPAGVDQNAIQTALTAQAEAIDADMGEKIGLRIAIISAARGFKIGDIAGMKLAAQIPDSKRTVMVVGWSTYAKVPVFKRFGIDPAALYAAKLLATPVQVSPAARSSSPAFLNITEVDTPVGNSAADSITLARMEAIVLDNGSFRCLNGRSTSSDPAWYWICYRRVYDKIRMDIFGAFQFVKSEPSSAELDAVVEQTVNGYLFGLMSDRVIAGYNPTVSNNANNPPASRASGKRYVDIGIEMIPPNDFTYFNINRVLTATVRLA